MVKLMTLHKSEEDLERWLGLMINIKVGLYGCVLVSYNYYYITM
jgi:hypothetical protein